MYFHIKKTLLKWWQTMNKASLRARNCRQDYTFFKPNCKPFGLTSSLFISSKSTLNKPLLADNYQSLFLFK
ncbi:hypothetical protein BpHYR1_004653 [Brachionus plicatilis]|uniref:Uncharacterized protein n=1 Tax=Brachionus plicatilis TaxID=10195 RepID=A0A3M7S821_BRAPC|nr:hypothetical protein BpHYR1_004653 [Brachionus plicatilis]